MSSVSSAHGVELDASMEILEYIDIPPAATQLLPSSKKTLHDSVELDLRKAPTVVTSLPKPSPPSSPSVRRRESSFSTGPNGLVSPTLSFLPQLLLSSSLPPGALPGNTTSQHHNGHRRDARKHSLLSSRDSISLPIMTNNFKRFVARVGPVFWLQDRIEEIIMWKKGWKVTGAWMALYAFLCYFPRLILLIPHIILIAIILATYPYPISSVPHLSNLKDTATANTTAFQTQTEDSIPWQANIQAIQNSMGAYADLHARVQPLTYHLSLSPPHLTQTSTASISAHPSPQSRSPYTPHILALLIVSFPPLLFLVTLPSFPVRSFCLFLGLAPFVVTNPSVQHLSPLIQPTTTKLFQKIKAKIAEYIRGRIDPENSINLLGDLTQLPTSTLLQRLIDDNNLTDQCWNAEMREVELWENERFGGPTPIDSTLQTSSLPPQRGWSKQNLRPGERTAWTRGRDGWSGVGAGGTSEGQGEVSSNLTFSLAPGWSFVETEDWRKDLTASWSDCGGDCDGWVYTNDAWIGSRPAPYTAGSGSMTRRRRWTRRIWYNHEWAKEES